jgi:hypothetical protein
MAYQHARHLDHASRSIVAIDVKAIDTKQRANGTRTGILRRSGGVGHGRVLGQLDVAGQAAVSTACGDTAASV